MRPQPSECNHRLCSANGCRNSIDSRTSRSCRVQRDDGSGNCSRSRFQRRKSGFGCRRCYGCSRYGRASSGCRDHQCCRNCRTDSGDEHRASGRERRAFAIGNRSDAGRRGRSTLERERCDQSSRIECSDWNGGSCNPSRHADFRSDL